MTKKPIRLTEQQFYSVIKESVKQAIKEGAFIYGPFDDEMDDLDRDSFDMIRFTDDNEMSGQEIINAIRNYSTNNNGKGILGMTVVWRRYRNPTTVRNKKDCELVRNEILSCKSMKELEDKVICIR